MTRILNEVLKPEHRQAGFYLEDDEDFLYLKRGEKVVAVWSAIGASIESVKAEADRQIAEANN